METRHIRLCRNGRNQAVRIPREFELPGEEAILTRDGEGLLLQPAKPRSLLAVLRTLKPLRESMPEISDKAPEPAEL